MLNLKRNLKSASCDQHLISVDAEFTNDIDVESRSYCEHASGRSLASRHRLAFIVCH